MWKKFNAKQDFINYLKGLQRRINIIDPKYLNSFEMMEEESYDSEELKNFFTALNQKDADNLMANYELTICSLLANRPIELISHASEVKYKDQLFPDCGEVSLLNFINFLIYNPSTQQFDLSLLERAGITIDQKLELFYKKYPLVEDIQQK